nr:hypothetical protein [Clostridium botulinum]
MSIAESKKKFNIDENEIIDDIDKSLSRQWPEPTELMKESANLLFRVPVF